MILQGTYTGHFINFAEVHNAVNARERITSCNKQPSPGKQTNKQTNKQTTVNRRRLYIQYCTSTAIDSHQLYETMTKRSSNSNSSAEEDRGNPSLSSIIQAELEGLAQDVLSTSHSSPGNTTASPSRSSSSNNTSSNLRTTHANVAREFLEQQQQQQDEEASSCTYLDFSTNRHINHRILLQDSDHTHNHDDDRSIASSSSLFDRPDFYSVDQSVNLMDVHSLDFDDNHNPNAPWYPATVTRNSHTASSRSSRSSRSDYGFDEEEMLRQLGSGYVTKRIELGLCSFSPFYCLGTYNIDRRKRTANFLFSCHVHSKFCQYQTRRQTTNEKATPQAPKRSTATNGPAPVFAGFFGIGGDDLWHYPGASELLRRRHYHPW